MNRTNIQWSYSTWNPVTGCSKISPGCKNCYAEKIAKRLESMGQKKYKHGFKLTLHENTLDKPLKMKKPHKIFVNSMSDLFHKDVPFDFIEKIFKIMNRAQRHQFQILTKRSKRLLAIADKLKWTPNIWMGVSVENNNYKYRIDNLQKTGSFIKFICFEPLLGFVENPDFSNIDWVIAGGESGVGSRRVKEEWILKIRDSCIRQNVPFFFKQWGGVDRKKSGRILQGKLWEQFPDVEGKIAKLPVDERYPGEAAQLYLDLEF